MSVREVPEALVEQLVAPVQAVLDLARQFPHERGRWGAPLAALGFAEAQGSDLRIAFLGPEWVVKIEDPNRPCGSLEREYDLYHRAGDRDRRFFPATGFHLDGDTPFLVQERCEPAATGRVSARQVARLRRALLRRFPVLLPGDVVRRNMGVTRDGRLVLFDWEFQR